MEKIIPASSTSIPTVDLSPFKDGGDEISRKKVIKSVFEALNNFGVFHIQIDEGQLHQCEKLLELTRMFFSYPDDKKHEYTHEKHVNENEKSGAGYEKFSGDKYHDFEYVLMYSPETKSNGVPTTPNDYRNTFEEVFKYFVKTSQLLEKIFNEWLELPPNTLKNYNDDRSWDIMIPLHYTLSSETEKIGIAEHQDPSLITLVLQDDVCGLELSRDGEWIPITPGKGKLVVIAGDIIQVLSNKKVRNVKHRALKNKESKRLAIDFCYNFGHEKWIEPLHQLMGGIGVKPKYKGFKYSEYTDLVKKDYEIPRSSLDDFTDIKRYEI